MCDDDGAMLANALELIDRVMIWAAYTEQDVDGGDPWLQGYEEAHRELCGYIRACARPGVVRAARKRTRPMVGA
jgi:hypothetical protein